MKVFPILFGSPVITSICESVRLGVCLLAFCLLWILATWLSLHVGLCPLLVLSTLDSAHVWFSLLGILFDLGICLLGICPLESLATWNFAHFCVCPLMFLSTLDSAHIWDCLLGIMFIKDFFYLRSCKLGMLFTWVFDYLDSVDLGVCPYDSQSTYVVARNKVFRIWSGSPFLLSICESVQLGVCLNGFCPLESLAAWHSLHVVLYPLLVLSTPDSTHVLFRLLGILSNWVFVYLDSVHFGVWPHEILPM